MTKPWIECALVLTLLSLPMSTLRAETILWNEKQKSSLSRGVLVTVKEFNDELLIQLSKRTLTNNQLSFLKLVILTEEKQRWDFLPISDGPSDAWIKRCSRAVTSNFKAAVLIQFGGEAVLRIRDGQSTRRILLTNRDPLKFQSSSSEIELLDVTMHQGGYFSFEVAAYSTGTISLVEAEHIYQRLQELLKSKDISIHIRRDSWFSTETCWWGNSAPANNDAFWEAPMITCAAFALGKVACNGKL